VLDGSLHIFFEDTTSYTYHFRDITTVIYLKFLFSSQSTTTNR